MVGISVWPVPKVALAQDIEVTVDPIWGDQVDPYDIAAQIRFLNSALEPVTPWEALNADQEFELWTAVVPNVPSDAVFYEIIYDEDLVNWNRPSPIMGEVNWGGIWEDIIAQNP